MRVCEKHHFIKYLELDIHCDIMTMDIQNVKLETKILQPVDMKVKILKDGETKPSKPVRSFSGFPKVEVIQIFTTTNYMPGIIKFKEQEV